MWHHGPIGDDEDGNTLFIDHREGVNIPYPDRIENLRIATRRQNVINTGLLRNNTTGVKGIYEVGPGYWRAAIDNITLGHFKNRQDAIQARQTAEVERHGIWARSRQMPTFAGLT